jgi:hypothetical protein
LIDVKPPLRTRLEVLWHQLRLHIVTFAAYPNSWPVSYYCRNCGTRWCGWADYLDIAADRQMNAGSSPTGLQLANWNSPNPNVTTRGSVYAPLDELGRPVPDLAFPSHRPD